MRGNEDPLIGDLSDAVEATIPMRGNELALPPSERPDVLRGYDPHEG